MKTLGLFWAALVVAAWAQCSGTRSLTDARRDAAPVVGHSLLCEARQDGYVCVSAEGYWAWCSADVTVPCMFFDPAESTP